MRPLLAPLEAFAYAPAYAYLNYKIRSSDPLDHATIWEELTRDLPPVADWSAPVGRSVRCALFCSAPK